MTTTEGTTAEAGTASHPGKPGVQRFPALDGLRIVGALAVVTTHVGFTSGASLNGPFAGLLARLDAGVPLFFVVSGFLLYRPHALATAGFGRGPATGRYFKHRALRILPALWLAVAGAALLLPHPPGATPGDWLRVATLTQIYTEAPSLPGLSQMWSLATEAAFYVVLPGLAWVLARRPVTPQARIRQLLWIAVVAVLLSVAWLSWAHATSWDVRTLWLPAYIGWFGIGIALAAWNVERQCGNVREGVLDHLSRSPGTTYAVAAALFVLLSTPIAGPYGLALPTMSATLVKNVGYGILGGLLVLPAVAPRPSGSRVMAVLGGGVGKGLGDISYGVFCYHLTILSLMERAVDHRVFGGQFALLWVLTVLQTLPLAWLSYRFLERPIMRYGRRREGGRSPTPLRPTIDNRNQAAT